MTRKTFIGSLAAAVSAGSYGMADGAVSAVFAKGADLFGAAGIDAKVKAWRAAGFNLVLVDVQDSVRYPSHPEIATSRSLPQEDVRRTVLALKGGGIAVAPLLDFATCNDSWLGEYDRMVCSKRYDEVVKDLIRDAYGLFGAPRFIHIGFEAEGRSKHPAGGYAVMRQGDLWMRYLAKTADWVKEAGARAWAWFDYPWGMKDFLADCPRDVVFSNLKPLSDQRTEDRFRQVAKAGCDVIPRIWSEAEVATARAKLPPGSIKGLLKEGAR